MGDRSPAFRRYMRENAGRSANTKSIFANQIEEFTGANAITIDCLIHDWLPDDANRPGRTSWGEFDMPGIYDALMAGGLLPPDTPRGATVPDDVLQQELAAITELEGKAYRHSSPPAA